MALADIKNSARSALHAAMSYPATYTAPGSVTPVPCTVRLHITSNKDMGVWRRTDGYALMSEQPTELVFLLSEVTPVRDAVVKLTDTGAEYRLERVLEAYGLTQNAEVQPL